MDASVTNALRAAMNIKLYHTTLSMAQLQVGNMLENMTQTQSEAPHPYLGKNLDVRF